MRNRIQNDLAIFQLTLAGCFAGAYFFGATVVALSSGHPRLTSSLKPVVWFRFLSAALSIGQLLQEHTP